MQSPVSHRLNAGPSDRPSVCPSRTDVVMLYQNDAS